LFTFIHSFL